MAGRFWKGFVIGALVAAAALIYAGSQRKNARNPKILIKKGRLTSEATGRRMRRLGPEAKRIASIYERGRKLISKTASSIDSES